MESYTHLNSESQRKTRRDKTFLSYQCQEIEEINGKGNATDLFKKIRETKGKFHAMRCTIKERNATDLGEAEDIMKRWQEYTDELYTKDLHDPVKYDGVITHLEPDILECEVKWNLGSIITNKAHGVIGIQLSYFKF